MAEIRITKPENYNENTIIISKEKNAPVMAVMFSNGLASNEEYMTLAEALAVTQIPALFTNNEDVTKFNEFKYFTNVTEIPDEFAMNAINLEEITLPKSITSLGVKSFCIQGATYNAGKRGKLKVINGVENVEIIKDYAFQYQTELETINFTSKLKIISRSAFYSKPESKLKNLGDLSGVESVGKSAFLSVTQIESLLMPKCKLVEQSAFKDCGLKYIELDWANVEFIGDGHFLNCNKLESLPPIPTLNEVPKHFLATEHADFKLKYLGGFPNATAVNYQSFINRISIINYGDLSKLEIIKPNYAFGANLSGSIYLPVCNNVGDKSFYIDDSEETKELEQYRTIEFGLPYEQITFSSNAFENCHKAKIICGGVELTDEQYQAVGATKPIK